MTDKAATDEKFVVVEDEAFIRLFVCEVLADAGFEVIEAQHADEAVAVLDARAREIHAMFTDINMPGSMDASRWPTCPGGAGPGRSPDRVRATASSIGRDAGGNPISAQTISSRPCSGSSAGNDRPGPPARICCSGRSVRPREGRAAGPSGSKARANIPWPQRALSDGIPDGSH
jgi:hypothetical protein